MSELQFKSLKDLEEYLSDTDMLDLEELTEALLREPAEAEEFEELTEAE